ncbi:MAG: transcriptional regulator [Anaerolineaceae bacterium]|nr:transcriptional regulator [Anaerolineaceae bacterium]
MESYEFVKDLFQVLGNPTRLKIFDILMTGVHCNCEIADMTGLAINLISHHLKVLQEADLIQSVRSEKDARWIYYSVNEETLRSIQTETEKFFDNNRIINREPVCPPCNKKTNQKE